MKIRDSSQKKGANFKTRPLCAKGESGKEWACDYCPKSFYKKEAFDTHIRRHKGEKPFKCDLCQKSFAEAWALTKHKRTHTGGRQQDHPFDVLEGDKPNKRTSAARGKGKGQVKPKTQVWNILKEAAAAGNTGTGENDPVICQDPSGNIQQVTVD